MRSRLWSRGERGYRREYVWLVGLQVKATSSVVVVDTTLKGIRLIEGIGEIKLKSEFVK